MTQAIATGEPNRGDFPESAIFVRNTDLVLQRVMSADGKERLWPIARRGKPLPPQLVDQMVGIRKEGKTIPEVAAVLGVGKSTVDYHLRQRREELSSPIKAASQGDSKTNASIKPEFSAMEITTLPYSVISAIRLALSTATTMAVLTDDRVIQAHYQGYVVGFQAALAIICGAAGIDLSFMEVDHDDKSTGDSHIT